MRAYNFAAGPAMLPDEVITKIKDELFDWRGAGVSVMEIGHRTAVLQDLITQLQDKIRNVMNIPNNYKILFLQGGAQGQFAGIPMNLVKDNKDVDYFITGIWSKKAVEEASKYANVNVVTQATATSIPSVENWQLNKHANYAYYCPNETINGIQFADIPEVGTVPLIADMTSNILSYDIDVSKFGLILASAQKNLGIAGVTLVIVREDLIGRQLDITPNIWNYKLMSEGNSSVNTVPVFAIYVMDLMVDWLVKQGGVKAIAKINYRKVTKLYNYIDSTEFYYNNVLKEYRSMVNIPFELKNKNLLNTFFDEADKEGLKYLKGHITVGGARASLYNVMPEAGVDKLISFMQDFAIKNQNSN
ncbi:MAG: 3-phosphoserine/phosphohydroxythreonine transaminase [Burkholderiales bacterium]|nr:3-phosphoserine/phosphohydroxythreonine transaminase [Burkholderiales bacterium]